MRLLTSTDLALRVLMRLSAAPDRHVSTEALAFELVVSRNHVHKIVQLLTEAGLVRTIRGARGGVMLARPAVEIRVGDVVHGNEEDQALAECFHRDGGACTPVPRCRLRGMLAGATDAFSSQSVHAGGLRRCGRPFARWRSRPAGPPPARRRVIARRASGERFAQSPCDPGRFTTAR